MAELLEKVCALCGMDLSGQKRVKNPSGEYFCPPCWKAQSSIFGESLEHSDQLQVTTPDMATKTTATSPAVRVVRSEPQPTMRQAVAEGMKEGAAKGLFKGFSKALVLGQVIVAAGLTKKFFPEANNGVMCLVALTGALAAIIEAELLARAMNIDAGWLDAETLKSSAGIIGIIGFALAYALAIFLACTGA
jgi:hypothetical protein